MPLALHTFQMCPTSPYLPYLPTARRVHAENARRSSRCRSFCRSALCFEAAVATSTPTSSRRDRGVCQHFPQRITLMMHFPSFQPVSF